MRPGACLTSKELKAYQLGTLSERDADLAITHLATCRTCQRTLKQIGDAGDALAARLRRPTAKDPYLGEPQFQEAQARAKAVIHSGTPRHATPPKPAALPDIAGPAVTEPPPRESFDPYHHWLGIPPDEQPPTHYRLLGVRPFEDDPNVIENAANRQMAHLRNFQRGERAAPSQRLLNEVAAAKLCLLKADKKAAYDEQLRKVSASTLDHPAVRAGVAPPPPPVKPAPNPMLGRQLGEYLLLEKLGGGGMGTVYKARHVKLNREVAVKILPKAREEDSKAVARFEREIQTIGSLDHANIVAAHDAREIEGTRFLVMELLDGVDLEQVIRRCCPLSVADACEIVRQTAFGLQYAHERGLVHRDIKPSNLMLTRQCLVKILDLGLANLQSEGGSRAEVSGTGVALGTLHYMAPEQISETHSVDIRADTTASAARFTSS